jgi:alpha-1,2-mannosyltransferase
MKKLLPKLLFVTTFLIMFRSMFPEVYPDFNAYYYGSMGNNILNYPPFVTILFSPFSFLPLVVASKIWVVLSMFFLLFSLYFCFKLFKIRLLSSTAMIFSSLAFIYFPTRFTLGMGQINILVLLFVVLTFYFYIKNKDLYAGICLGVSIILKLFPVLLILYFLCLRKFKMLLFAMLTFISLGGVSYFFINPEINNYYWQHLPSILNSVPVDYYNQALSGFLARSVDPITFRNFFRITISIFMIIFSFWVILRKSKRDFSRRTLEFGSLITLNTVVNGYSWQHHFVWLILPFLITFFYIRNKRLDVGNYIFLGTSYLLTCINIKNFTLYPAIIQSHMFYGAVMLWLMMEYLLLKND